MSENFYRHFEDRYRGSRDTIKARLRNYLPFLDVLRTHVTPTAALDVGCGRGEWLELLQEHGFTARGVDLDEGMLAACRSRHLDVANLDAIAALRAQPNDSLAVVSGFHLVEHIPFDLVQVLCEEALRALAPGGLLILETPNPENLVVGTNDFYLDPTHQRPLPPQLLGFVAEHAGFARHVVMRQNEGAPDDAAAPIELLTVLEGASPDYAVVAQKSAEGALLAAFDVVFQTRYGIDMKSLARRYTGQLALADAEIHRALRSHETRLTADRAATTAEHAKAMEHLAQYGVQHGYLNHTMTTLALEHGASQVRVEQLARQFESVAHSLATLQRDQQAGATLLARIMEERADDMAMRADAIETLARSSELHKLLDTAVTELVRRHDAIVDARLPLDTLRSEAEAHQARTEGRLRHLEAQLEIASRHAQRVHDMTNSRSWRMTAPVRALGIGARAGKASMVPLARRGVEAVLRRPLVRKLALAGLALVPGARQRLRDRLYPEASAAAVALREQAALAAAAPAMQGHSPATLSKNDGEMPARMEYIYAELKRAQQARTK